MVIEMGITVIKNGQIFLHKLAQKYQNHSKIFSGKTAFFKLLESFSIFVLGIKCH
jgi:hypothetical protein